MLEERAKVAGKKFLLIVLIALISAQFVSTIRVDAQTVPIGTTTQPAPFESNPTAGTSSGFTPSGAIGNAYDGDWSSECNFMYGVDGHLELSSFDAPTTTFAIGWVDFKINYQAMGTSTSDERYRIVYQVGSSSWQVLQDWVSGTDAKYNFKGLQSQRSWSNQPEPNNGAWDWTDISQVKFRVETGLVTADHSQKFTLYEVWLSVYPAPLPPTGVSIQPSFVNVTKNDVFFIDVYAVDVAQVWGYQFRITYDTKVLTAIEFFTYYPFIDRSPSKINDTTGTVDVSYTYVIDQGNVSFTGDSPLTRIYFWVDDVGESSIHFSKAALVKWGSGYLPVQTTDGRFDNRIGFPTASFTWTPTEPLEGEMVAFDASDSYDSDGTIVSYSWDFGDGQTGTGVTTTHAYPEAKDYPGTYAVTLNVTDNDGKYDLETTYIAVTKHDVAVTYFKVDGANSTSPLNVTAGSSVPLKPTVSNLGFFPETFTITFYANNTAIDTAKLDLSTTISLTPGQIAPLTFKWDTAGMSLGLYVVNATVGPVAGEIHTGDNSKIGDGYSSSVLLRPNHDMAVLIVAVSPTEVNQGGSVTVNVTVKNKGDVTEEFDVNIYSEDLQSERTVIGSMTDTLVAGASTTLILTWNTTGVVPGIYQIYVEVPAVPGEISLSDNTKYSADYVKVAGHNILVSGITFVPASPPFMIGETVQIKVTVKNTGSENETNVTVTVKRNGTVIGSTILASLNMSKSTTATINWNTSGLSPGSYNLTAIVDPVAGETNTQDNTYVFGLVKVGYHDIAVTNVTASPRAVELGQKITIYATVKNTGLFTEQKINVTAYYNQTKIETITVEGLSAGASNNTLNFVLTTTGMARGLYDIKVVASPMPNEVSTNDNTRIFHFVAVGYHDIAVIDVTASPTDVVVGDSVSISVTVVNHGNFTETFDLTVSYDDTKIATQTVSDLAPGHSDTISFSWNTGSISPDDYIIEAEASVEREAHVADNTMFSDTVKVNAGSNMLLYVAVGAAIIIVLAVVLFYFFKLRKSKS